MSPTEANQVADPDGVRLPPRGGGGRAAQGDRPLRPEILRLVKRRIEVSQSIGRARMAAGGTKIVYNREIDVLARYRELGPEGRQLAMALLNLGRGPLGR